MSKENNAIDNGWELRQLILLQQQQKEENFSLLASSLGDTLNTFGNSFKQYLETMMRKASRSPMSEDPYLGNRQNMLSEDLKENRLVKRNIHFASSSSPDGDAKNNNTRTNGPEDADDGNRPRLRTKRKFKGSDNANSSTSSSTKRIRHKSSSSEDSQDDDANDDDRLSVKVKHNEYADPPLEDPLQTLNKVVTKSHEKLPKQLKKTMYLNYLQTS